jgi:hypothetical protein
VPLAARVLLARARLLVVRGSVAAQFLLRLNAQLALRVRFFVALQLRLINCLCFSGRSEVAW